MGDTLRYFEVTVSLREELAIQRAENEMLRNALSHIKSRYEEGTIAHYIAKEALK